MITVHHLNNSRSQRILWLLEELGTPYRVEKYQRDSETNLAPDNLKSVHPLGKSPVIEDDGRIVAESGQIVDYLIRHYGGGNFMPEAGTDAYETYMEWLHFAEGSAMLPLLLALYTRRLGDAAAPLQPRIQSEIMNHLGFMSSRLGDQDYFMGDMLTGADVLLIFVVEAASISGATAAFPNLEAYAKRIQARPAYQKAIEVGGPYDMAQR